MCAAGVLCGILIPISWGRLARVRLVLIGNYGVGNVGDEALKDYFLERFPDVQWQVLSAHPGANEYPRLPAGLRSFLSLSWVRTLRLVRRCDGVVFGGGTLFTDVESPRACVIWWIHAAVARFFRKPIVFAFQGVGPFGRPWAERLARQAFRWGRGVSVRDPASYRRVEAWSLSHKIVQAFDPVILVLQPNSVDRTQKLLSIIPRHNSGQALRQQVEQLQRAHQFDRVRIILMQPDEPGEKRIAEELSELVPVSDVRPVRTLAGLEEALRGSSQVVTERYHGGIVALAMGIPTCIVSQREGDKLSLLRELTAGMPAEALVDHLRELALAGERDMRDVLMLQSSIGHDGAKPAS